MSPIAELPETVDGIMIPVETGCLLDNYPQDVTDVLEQLDREYMPVVDSFVRRHPVGVVTRTNLRGLVQDAKNALVSDVLIAGVPLILSGTRLDQLSDRLAQSPVVLIVDQAGALLGYVEVTAILPYLLRLDGHDEPEGEE
jgi:predicted transcriptional regulator